MKKLSSGSNPGVQLCAVLFVFAFLPWTPPKDILGVSLRPAAETLLNRIEHEFRAPLDIQRRSSSTVGEIWRGYVSDKGVPTLEIPPEARITEAQIVHELLHLDQRLRGFPNGVTFVSDKDSPVIPKFGPVNERLTRILGFLLYDTIEHVIFSNRLAEMGIDPHGISRAAIERVVSARGLPSEVVKAAQAGSLTVSLALWHFKVAIEAGDPQLVAASDKANTISPTGLRKGKMLAKLVESPSQNPSGGRRNRCRCTQLSFR